MKCNVCGKENIDEAKFCAGCGNELAETVEAEVIEDGNAEIAQEPETPHVPKCFDVFAKLGFGLGLGGLIGCIFLGFGFVAAMPGIVFSALGKKSIKYHNKAKKGLVLSILGTVIGIIVYFAFCIILGIIAGLAESGYYY
jgi:hypothetical protein